MMKSSIGSTSHAAMTQMEKATELAGETLR